MQASQVLDRNMAVGQDSKVFDEPKQKKLYPCVKKDDIVKEAESIYYRLYSKNFSMKDSLNRLQTNNVKATKNIRLKDLIEIFMSSPFSVGDYEDAKLIARYMIEDNYYEKLPYNENAEADIMQVNSVFKNLFSGYTIMKGDEELKSLNRIAQGVLVNKLIIENTFIVMMNVTDEYVTR